MFGICNSAHAFLAYNFLYGFPIDSRRHIYMSHEISIEHPSEELASLANNYRRGIAYLTQPYTSDSWSLVSTCSINEQIDLKVGTISTKKM